MASNAFAYRTKSEEESSSDSGSDEEFHDWKRATKRGNDYIDTENSSMVLPQKSNTVSDASTTQQRKRNNIWCEVIQDQMMSETLNHIGIKQKPENFFSRGEESYDYTLKYESRKHDDEAEESLEDNEKVEEIVETHSKGKRYLHNKNKKFVKVDSTEAAAAMKIIKSLQEKKSYLIFRCVKYLGIEKAMKLLQMTETIEDEGGMMILNNSRRRTPGGVYFQLLRTDKEIKPDIISKIFEGELNSFEMKQQYQRNKQLKKLQKAKKKALESIVMSKISESKPDQPELDSIMETDENLLNISKAEVSLAIHTNENNMVELEDGEIED